MVLKKKYQRGVNQGQVLKKKYQRGNQKIEGQTMQWVPKR